MNRQTRGLVDKLSSKELNIVNCDIYASVCLQQRNDDGVTERDELASFITPMLYTCE